MDIYLGNDKGVIQKQALLLLVIACSFHDWTLYSWVFNLVWKNFFFWHLKWWVPKTMTYMTIGVNCKILKLLSNDHILDCRTACSSQGEHHWCGSHLLIRSEAAKKLQVSYQNIQKSMLVSQGRKKYSFLKPLSFNACTWLQIAQIIIFITTVFFSSSDY